MSRSRLTYAFFLAVLVQVVAPHAAAAGAQPIIGPGREAEIESIFSGFGKGDLTGWQVPDIYIPEDRIRATLLGPEGERAVLELRHLSGAGDADSRTSQFELFLFETEGIDADQRSWLVRATASTVEKRTPPDFWREVASDEGGPAVVSTWVSSPNGRATMVWWAGLLALLVLVAWILVQRAPWKQPEGRRALVEISVLVVSALVLRVLAVQPGPLNFYTRLPDPNNLWPDFPLFGPGFGAWMLLWFWPLGASDGVAFFAGATAGALAVVPAYLVAWWGVGGKRWWAVVAGAAVALWPLSVRLSPCDEPWPLVALLLLAAIALAIGAERFSSPLALCASWLAVFLAATTRPEPVFSLLPLGILILLSPKARRLQFRPIPLIATGIMGVIAIAGVLIAGLHAIENWEPFSCLSLNGFPRLFGFMGGSVFVLPRTPWVLALCAVFGLVLASRLNRGRAVLWALVGFLPALPTSPLANDGLVTSRYQLPLSAVAAVLAGIGLAWLASVIGRRLRLAAPVVFLVPGFFALWPLLSPPEEPTFRLEYRFFREHLNEVPCGCLIVRVRWNVDLGLSPPMHLSSFRQLRHTWIDPSHRLDVRNQCVVYWRPASCRAVPPGKEDATFELLPDCRLIESSYRLEPLAEARLPARRGFVDEYAVDPVPVGFYRLRPLGMDHE